MRDLLMALPLLQQVIVAGTLLVGATFIIGTLSARAYSAMAWAALAAAALAIAEFGMGALDVRGGLLSQQATPPGANVATRPVPTPLAQMLILAAAASLLSLLGYGMKRVFKRMAR
jgi:hypothetical protein